MSRSLQTRAVEQKIYVYYCDRCGTELKRCAPNLDSAPGEGSSLSVREHVYSGKPEWLPLARPGAGANIAGREPYDAANVDLCPDCTASLLIWFDQRQEDAP